MPNREMGRESVREFRPTLDVGWRGRTGIAEAPETGRVWTGASPKRVRPTTLPPIIKSGSIALPEQPGMDLAKACNLTLHSVKNAVH